MPRSRVQRLAHAFVFAGPSPLANAAWTRSVHLDAPGQRRGQQPVSGTADPGVVKQDKSSRGSVDTTKTRSGPQRVRRSSGKRPIGATKGKQSDTEALCQTPTPPENETPPPSPKTVLAACRRWEAARRWQQSTPPLSRAVTPLPPSPLKGAVCQRGTGHCQAQTTVPPWHTARFRLKRGGFRADIQAAAPAAACGRWGKTRWPWWFSFCPNSIAFGSAPRREADSQPISQLVRQAVS